MPAGTHSERWHSLSWALHGVSFVRRRGVVGRSAAATSSSRYVPVLLGGSMSVDPSEMTNEVWTRWQGHLINGTYPLGRLLGGSEHSGVFLTRSAAHGSSDLAIKLVPTNRALAEAQLRRWKRAARLEHPRLLRLIEWGGCQLDGLPYAYAVMEYADQTLAQLLRNRALSDEEAREMLPAILEALTFLHGRGLVQGQLKPANILVVGDQLKLASDTVRRVSEGTLRTSSTVYDPPELRQGSSSTAGDLWALGVSLCEALTRRLPTGLSAEVREAATVPAGYTSAFRDVMARCLSQRPQLRPGVRDLDAWARSGTPLPAPSESLQPALSAPPARAEKRVEPQSSVPEVAAASPAAAAPATSGKLPLMVIGAVGLLAAAWATVHVLGRHAAHVDAPLTAATAAAPEPTQAASSPVAATKLPTAAAKTATPARPAGTTPQALHSVIPEVPWSARRTIRGHIKVWVRVVVNQDGTVFAAIADRSGPSRYFQRVATEAAQQWTFPPADDAARRLVQVRFDFGREGTTGNAVALR
jgi:TonB family protein